MPDQTRVRFTPELPAAFWADAGVLARSAELTPLYVERYVGVRHDPTLSTHAFWELTYVFRGQGHLWAGTGPAARTLPLADTTAYLIPPGLPHREAADDERLDTLWVGLRGPRLDGLGRCDIVRVRHADLAPWCERLWERAQRPYGRIGLELDGLTLHLLGLILRLDQGQPTHRGDRIDDAVALLNQRFSEPLAMSALATECGYSEGHFYRSFRERTGRTPVQYLTEVRVRHARHWLRHTTLSVERIAEMCGFRDPLYFSRVFRRATGQAPTATRARRGRAP